MRVSRNFYLQFTISFLTLIEDSHNFTEPRQLEIADKNISLAGESSRAHDSDFVHAILSVKFLDEPLGSLAAIPESRRKSKARPGDSMFGLKGASVVEQVFSAQNIL